MPVINFDKINDEPEKEFSIIPEGWYLTKIDNVEEVQTKSGFPMFKLTHTIQAGRYSRRKIFDNLVFNDNKYCQAKIKGVCKHIGMDVTGIKDIKPSDLLNALVCIHIIVKEEENRDEKNEVEFFGGYKDADFIDKQNQDLNDAIVEKTNNIPDDDIPF